MKETLRIKWLTQALLVSGALNIGLMATFVYFVLKQENTPVFFELKPAETSSPISNQEILRSYSLLSFQELMLRLEDQEFIEEGFTKRDLALSCLVAFHHFDIDKALGGCAFQKRKIAFRSQDGLETQEILVFPGLKDAQYNAINHYAKIEKWPFTPRGLFYEMQRTKQIMDPALLETFFLTREFETVSLLFSRGSSSLDKNRLMTLLLEGNWDILEKFVEEQKLAQDLTPTRRVGFLLDYLHRQSKTAAHLLLETDFEFVCRRLDDPHALLLLDLLSEHTLSVEKFAKVLLISPRSDAVWKKASLKLFAFAGEPAIEPFNRELVLKRFIPQALARKETPAQVKAQPAPAVKPPTAKKKTHIVQEGESLWKIAKKYHVSIEEIKRLNHLETEKLRPGKELLIQGTSSGG